MSDGNADGDARARTRFMSSLDDVPEGATFMGPAAPVVNPCAEVVLDRPSPGDVVRFTAGSPAVLPEGLSRNEDYRVVREFFEDRGGNSYRPIRIRDRASVGTEVELTPGQRREIQDHFDEVTRRLAGEMIGNVGEVTRPGSSFTLGDLREAARRVDVRAVARDAQNVPGAAALARELDSALEPARRVTFGGTDDGEDVRLMAVAERVLKFLLDLGLGPVLEEGKPDPEPEQPRRRAIDVG